MTFFLFRVVAVCAVSNSLMTSGLNREEREEMSKQSTVRVLVVDDFVPWCQFVLNEFQVNPRWFAVDVAGDGIEAVRKARELQPDIIFLDIGLPKLNGIEVARLVRKASPSTRILFLTAESDCETARAAFQAGGDGYVAKLDAGTELLAAAEAVLLGKQYVSRSLAGYGLLIPE
jgi:DNA-binding response OmpR family regulator